jgi:hypothetical protein
MDSPCRAFFGDMWYAMWFLTVREIWPCKAGSLEEWSRSPKLVTSLSQRVKWLQQEIPKVRKEVTIKKYINTSRSIS